MSNSIRPAGQEAELSAQRQALEALAKGTPLQEFLHQLCLLLEPLLEEGRCSILLLDGDRLHMRHGAAPSLPKAYLDLIDGLAIGPGVGSCGTAMHFGTPIVVEAIEQDPLWAPYKAAALPHGLRACASVPILTVNSEVLGAFAIYREQPGPYPQADLELLRRFTGVAALALEGARRITRIQDEEARHRALVNQSRDGLFYFSVQDSRILESNPAFQTLLGYSEEEVVNKQLYDLIAEDPSSIQDNIGMILAKGYSFLGERLYRHRSGELIPVEVSATALQLGGHPVFSVLVRDLRARKAADRDLAEREAQLRAIMEEAGDAIFVSDGQGRYLDANAKALEFTGYDLEEFQTLHVTQLVAPDDLASQPPRFAELQSGQTLLVERRILRKDGRIVPMELNARLLSDGRLLFVARDISVRKRMEQEAAAAEAALAESERTFRSLFDLSPAAMVLSRPTDGAIHFANPAALAMLQLAVADIRGKRTVDFFANPEDRERLLTAMAATGRTHDFELEMVVHGQQKVVLLSAGLLTYQGNPAILVALTDITERQREEEASRQRQKLESLGVLAGGIAHDFNNLLTAILGNLNLAQLHLPEDTAAAPFLVNMEALIQRTSDLSRQMLAYSGKGRFRQEWVSLNHLVEEMTQLLSVSISKRVQLNLELEPNLPALEGDPVQLQQVVMNLVTNASEAIGDQDGIIRIRTALEYLEPQGLLSLRMGQDLPSGKYLLLEVEDTGSGMSPETMELIFDPFFTTKSTGRGLGLSVLLGILRGHQAGLAIDSSPGLGTCFRLYFKPSTAIGEAALPPPLAVTEPMEGRVLIVDDEAPVRASLSHLLGHLGLTVSQACDGVEGLERLTEYEGQVDCVILDLTMPRMGGKEALGHIRERWPQLPVILSSGFSTEGGDLDLGGPGAFLGKPYRLADLREALLKVLPRGPGNPA